MEFEFQTVDLLMNFGNSVYSWLRIYFLWLFVWCKYCRSPEGLELSRRKAWGSVQASLPSWRMLGFDKGRGEQVRHFQYREVGRRMVFT